VVLADAEHVEPDLVGELDLLDQVAQALLGRDRLPAGGIGGALAEGVDAELDLVLLVTVAAGPADLGSVPVPAARGRADWPAAPDAVGIPGGARATVPPRRSLERPARP
jgi:hypothetical protein